MLILRACEQVFFKMDSHGNGQEVELDRVFSSATLVPSFRHFNQDLFTGYFQFLAFNSIALILCVCDGLAFFM